VLTWSSTVGTRQVGTLELKESPALSGDVFFYSSFCPTLVTCLSPACMYGVLMGLSNLNALNQCNMEACWKTGLSRFGNIWHLCLGCKLRKFLSCHTCMSRLDFILIFRHISLLLSRRAPPLPYPQGGISHGSHTPGKALIYQISMRLRLSLKYPYGFCSSGYMERS